MGVLRGLRCLLPVVLVAAAAFPGVSRAQTVSPASAPAYVPLEMRWGYYPMYSPVFNRVYFAAWAEANRQTALAAAPPAFFDTRTTLANPGYAAYYYNNLYYTPRYSRYFWYNAPALNPRMPVNYLGPLYYPPAPAR